MITTWTTGNNQQYITERVDNDLTVALTESPEFSTGEDMVTCGTSVPTIYTEPLGKKIQTTRIKPLVT